MLGLEALDCRKRKLWNSGPRLQPLCLPHPQPHLPPSPLGILS